MGDAVQPRPLLVVALDDVPGRLGDVGARRASPPWPWCSPPSARATAGPSAMSFHCFSGSWMRIRKRSCCSSSVIENQYLTSRMPERTSMRSNSGTSRKNSSTWSSRAEAHHPLDAGAVVPGAVEQHDLAAGRQMRHVALEVPLRALALGRRRQRHDAADARVEPLGDALDDAALAGGVAALEQDDDLLLLCRRTQSCSLISSHCRRSSSSK